MLNFSKVVVSASVPWAMHTTMCYKISHCAYILFTTQEKMTIDILHGEFLTSSICFKNFIQQYLVCALLKFLNLSFFMLAHFIKT